MADDGSHGLELWRSDGTPDGTTLVKDVWPGPEGSQEPWYPYRTESWLTAVGGTMYFAARSPGSEASPTSSPTEPAWVHGLWRSDGTEGGTVLVKDVRARYLTTVGAGLFFVAFDEAHGYEVWRSDGTGAGTDMVMDIDPGRDPSYAMPLAGVDGTLFFQASVSRRRGDSIVSRSFLWKTGGTEEGTAKIAPIWIGPWDPDAYWYLPMPLAAIGPMLFFTSQDPEHGLELWRSDGTRTGTVLVKDIAPGRDDSIPYWFTDIGGTLHFFAFADGPYGRVSLWTSDGTRRGTVMIAGPFRRPQSPDEEPPGPGWITDVNGTILLMTSGRSTGYELWKLAAPAPPRTGSAPSP